VTIEPQAQLVFQTASLDRAADFAAEIRFDDMESLAGRIGARVAKTWAEGEHDAVTVWARANLWYEFMGDDQFGILVRRWLSSRFMPILAAKWLELDAGITAEVASNVSVHGNVTYETDFGQSAARYEAQLGVRIAW
jgi:outer membrane autotransporter protein